MSCAVQQYQRAEKAYRRILKNRRAYKIDVEEFIAAADQHGLAMVFTGVRHFRH